MSVDTMLKLCLLICVSTVAYVYAAVGIFPYETKPAEFADQPGCYLQTLNRVLPYGEPYFPKENNTCVQYTCNTNNETQLLSCGAVGFPDNCRLEKNFTLDYPKCCGTIVCDPTTPSPTTEEPITEEPSTEEPCPKEPSTEHPFTGEPSTEPPCVTVVEPSSPVLPRLPKIPEGKKNKLPIEPKPDC